MLLDNEVPYANARLWRRWTKEERDQLPGPWPESGTRKRTDDGTEYELKTRTTAVDPLDQTAWLEMRAEKWRDGRLVAEEEHVLSMRAYFRDELLLMLDRAGFGDVVVDRAQLVCLAHSSSTAERGNFSDDSQLAVARFPGHDS